MTDSCTRASKGTACYDHRSEIRSARQHGGAASGRHHCAIEIMCVVFGITPAGVDEIGIEGFVAEGAGRVLDLVGRVEEISI